MTENKGKRNETGTWQEEANKVYINILTF